MYRIYCTGNCFPRSLMSCVSDLCLWYKILNMKRYMIFLFWDNGWYVVTRCVINNTRFIFLIQHTLKLSNIRNGLLLNIFLSIVMPGFTSLMESWMPSCFILPLFSINQTVQQVSCVKNRLIRGEFTHLFNLFQSVIFVKNLMTTNYFSAKKLYRWSKYT